MRDVAQTDRQVDRALRVLAIDTSTSVTAVAVTEGARVLAEDHAPSHERHGNVILPRVQAVLAAASLQLADIDLLAVGVGPGSFTGLRVGLATVKGLAFALQKPLRGVSSLEVIASAALEHAQQAAVLIDAFKNEVYAGVFQRVASSPSGEVEARVALFHAPPAEAAARVLEQLDPTASAIVCGDGIRRYETEIQTVLRAEARVVLAAQELDGPRGRFVARLALRDFARSGASDLAALEPAYVRGSDAKLPDRPLAVD
jgi:tRNA threonylcarbamoyladenosine biosynthesis protein TsaB